MMRRDASGGAGRYAWYVVALLTLTQILSYIDRFLPTLLVEPIKADLHLTDFQIGLLLGPAFAMFYVILGLPIGWLADRLSRRAILAAGIAIWCFMTAAGSLARGFLPLFGARLGVGLGEATVAPCAISLVSDYFPRERRARAFSVLMSGAFLGAGSAFLFGGLLVRWIESLPPFALPLVGVLRPWQQCFLVVGIPGLLLAILMLTVREPARRDSFPAAKGGDRRGSSLADALGFIAKRWRAFGALFVASACNVTLGSLTVWNVAVFKRTWNWSVADVGVAVGILFFTGGPIGTLIGLWLTNRGLAARRKDATMRALLAGIIIAVPAFAAFPLMPAAPLAIAALFFAFIGMAMATAAGPASLTLLAPGQIRAQATALYYLVISVAGQVLGPPPVGWLVDRMGDPRDLRYAISIEAIAVGIPGILLVAMGLPAFRRAATELEDMIADAIPARRRAGMAQ